VNPVSILDCREVVQHMALRMEESLRAHDEDRGRAGWLDGTFDQMMAHLREALSEEVNELDLVTCEPFDKIGVELAWKEASDVANFAMMIADRYHRHAMSLGRLK
jgi:hypothetical protein